MAVLCIQRIQLRTYYVNICMDDMDLMGSGACGDFKLNNERIPPAGVVSNPINLNPNYSVPNHTSIGGTQVNVRSTLEYGASINCWHVADCECISTQLGWH